MTLSQKENKNRIIFILCLCLRVCVCTMFMCVHHVYVVPVKARRDVQIPPRTGGPHGCEHVRWVLETKSVSSLRIFVLF